MADEEFTLTIYTPVGKVLEDTVSQVTLPAAGGEMGVLPQHVSYAGLLGTGVLEYYSAEKKQGVRLVVSEGFCEFDGKELNLLADSVVTVDSVDRDGYADNRKELADSLVGTDTQTLEWKHADVALKRIEAIDRLISH